MHRGTLSPIHGLLAAGAGSPSLAAAATKVPRITPAESQRLNPTAGKPALLLKSSTGRQRRRDQQASPPGEQHSQALPLEDTSMCVH